MTGSYDLQLVALSLIVAIIASYTALELAGRVSQTSGRTAWAWLIGGAVAMGAGISSMHFIGISVYPSDGSDLDALKVNTDAAMYEAKRGGRSSYRFFAPEMLTTVPQEHH